MPILLPLLFALAATPALPPVSRDAAGNLMVRLRQPKGPDWFAAKPGERSAMRCSSYRPLCLQAQRDATKGEWRVNVWRRVPVAARTVDASYIVTVDGDNDPEIWPFAVIEADGGRLLVGHVLTQSTGYSGGGASSAALTLREIVAGDGGPAAVATVPWRGSAMIRACFGERDSRVRAGACHDEYSFSATLALDPANRSGRPRFRLTTVAKTYPGRLSRNDDNSAKRLRKQDLVWWRDPQCSYSRLLSWSPKGYTLDRPAPACTAYLEL